MNPIRAAVSRPYTVAVAVILTLCFSVLAVRRIPVQLKPTVDTPRITVATNYRGASAVEVEEELTRELEDVLQATEGLQKMISDSSEGRSNITLEFAYGADMSRALVDVSNKLTQVPRLPDEADEPEVSVASAGDAEVMMWIVIHSNYDPDFVRRIVEEDVESRLERVLGVASLFVVGGSDREVQVRFEPDLLVAYGLTVDELLAAIGGSNLNVRGGTVETEGRQFVVRTVGRVEEARRLEDLIVKEGPGGSVRLGQVARVVDTSREMNGFVNFNGKPAVAMGVRREVGANVIETIARLDETIDGINAIFQNRGYDLWLTPVYRDSDYIRSSLGFVQTNLLVGAGLAVVVLLLFLRSWRSVMVVALTIPISLVAVFPLLAALDRSLNVISLAGIAFASGMVVDNAIVVLENIFRHLEMGKSPFEAAVDGGREVWGGVLASTLTTVAVFIPIVLQNDEASQLFTDMALAISAAVIFSLLVALTVVPVLTALFFKRARPQKRAGELGPLGRAYGRFCDRLARPRPGSALAKWGFLLLVVAGSLASLKLAPPAEYLPTGNRNLVLFFCSPIPGTRPEAVRANYAPFEQFVLSQPEVERMFSVAGPFFNGGGVILKEEHANPQGLADFHQRLFGPAFTTAGFRFMVPVRASLFESPGKEFEVELSGPDFKALEEAAGILQGELIAVPGVTGVRSSLVTGRPELRVTIDQERARDLELDVASVGRVVETVVAGRRLTTLIDAGREVEVNVVAPPERVDSPGELRSLRFVGPAGRAISLGSVARVERTVGPESIRRLERERNVLMTVNIADEAPLERVVDEVENELFPSLSAQLGPAFALRVGGSADDLRRTLSSLSGGFGLSVFIIYLLLVALFRSWLAPGVILASVPLALSGGLLGIRLASELSGGATAFDVIAMLGFVILAGLVVNNAILIVHQANNFREEGLGAREALAQSARSRLRPIVMSVVTTVFGMLPLALGGGAGAELYQGLGAVIVGGLLVSTLFTLFLVPVLVSLGHDLRGLGSEGEERRGAQPAVGVGGAGV